jgi:hypothetical protein
MCSVWHCRRDRIWYETHTFISTIKLSLLKGSSKQSESVMMDKLVRKFKYMPGMNANSRHDFVW